ncbi:MAG: hypothetical protein ACLFN8_01660 [Candidatus Woesearchaeota archaeon]
MTNKVFNKNKKRYKLTLLLILIAFILGTLLGYITTRTTQTELELELENLNLDLRSFREYLLFAEAFEINSCDETFIEQLNNKMYDSGITLDEMEQEDQLDTPKYELLKQKHNINQVIFYSKLKQYRENCNYEKDVILFFFDGKKPEDAKKQGLILEKILETENVAILPMDYGYTNHIYYFYEYYKIQNLPALIINYDLKLEGISNEEKIRAVLN